MYIVLVRYGVLIVFACEASFESPRSKIELSVWLEKGARLRQPATAHDHRGARKGAK
jgi:hypothetical protein